MISVPRGALLLLGSGCCALVYQTVWLREFRLIFGASTQANAAVLAIFLGGLGVGGLLLGKRAQRADRPLLWYAGLEFLIAALAALSPWLLDAARAVYLGSGGSTALGAGATALRLVLSTLVLGPAVVLMGGTLPAAARAVTRGTDAGRLGLAVLYGVNTLGAVLGVLGSTFVVLEILGFRQTLWCACLINVVVALLARAWDRASQEKGAAAAPPTRAEEVKGGDAQGAPEAPSPPSAAPVAVGATQGRRRMMLGAAFVTGFVFLLLELVWYRMASPILGGSTYTFGVILAVALLGIGLGGVLYGQRREGVRPTLGLFAATCALEAVCLLAPFALGDELALLAVALRGWGAQSFGLLALGWGLIAAILVLPASLVAGYQFPLLIALTGQADERLAQDVGEVYAANTLGSILGSLLGGFVILPGLGALLVWKACGGVMLALGGVFLACAWGQERRKLVPVLGLVALSLLLASAQGPTALWRHAGVGAGRLSWQHKDLNLARGVLHHYNARILEEHEGVESSLAFIGSSSMSVLVNGKSDGDVVNDATTTVGLGLVPALVHGRPKRAFVIGLASGVTAGWLAEVPGMERVDVAEIEPDMLRFSEQSAAANFNVNRHPKARLLWGDGRELLLTSQEPYDLIVSEPSNPYRAGIANFYTQEFYQEARGKLAPGGIFAQWVQGYEISPEALQLIARTLCEVFGDVSVWLLTDGDFVFLASVEPRRLDLAQLRADTQRAPYRDFLHRIAGLHGVEGLLSLHLANDRYLRTLAQGARAPNTEDQPALEFFFARSVGASHEDLTISVHKVARQHGHHRPEVEGQINWAWVERYQLRSTKLRQNFSSPESKVWIAFERQSLDQLKELVERGQIPSDYPPEDHYAAMLRLEARFLGAPPEQQAEVRREIEAWEGGGDRDALLFLWAGTVGVGDVSQRSFEQMIAQARKDPWMHQQLLAQVLTQLEAVRDPQVVRAMIEALREPFAARLLESKRQETLEVLLLHSMVGSDPDPYCVPFFQAQEPWPTWLEEVLRLRVQCYARLSPAGAPGALADLDRFVRARGRRLEDLSAPPRGTPGP